ncbi:cation/H(+) antiporter [Amycolatopsis balhimycina DSM 5908]|uniref:Cation/H(+) antiporter n=1 Tax=Amycolatopsis balhimycina DSM 5908 TaxID=1081091 RepID=A0A428WUA9_AMYBA|nr:cation:proton antiporter [Amycolatopsis balhimycina]RSM46649.1 cation/H(+) antiporter [Amycolatopsis balhimycina DSM 5908]
MTPHFQAGAHTGGEAVAGIVLADLGLLLVTAFAFAVLAKRLRQPAVLGEIVAGIALGPSLLGLLPGHLTEVLFPMAARPYLQVLSQLGLVLFMFGVGYELRLSRLRGVGRQVTAVSLASVALPFALGAGLALLLYPWLDRHELKMGGPLGPALFLGAAMSITAFPVLARIVAERGIQHSRLGTIALASAAVQDFLAWCVLAVVVAVVTVGGPWPLGRIVIGSAVFVLVLVYLVRPALKWLLAPERRWAGSKLVVHTVLLSGLLACAWTTDLIGLHVVFGAFLFGAVVPRRPVAASTPEAPDRIQQMSLLLLPVFFTVTGLSVDLGTLGMRGVVIVLAVVAVACLSKFAGAAGAARLTGVSGRRSVALGILLNTRGLTELVILNVGLSLGVLDTRLFTAMVIMAVLTTMMTGPLLTLARRRAAAGTATPEAEEAVRTG